MLLVSKGSLEHIVLVQSNLGLSFLCLLRLLCCVLTEVEIHRADPSECLSCGCKWKVKAERVSERKIYIRKQEDQK